jgi:excisionase family DNA binding protein
MLLCNVAARPQPEPAGEVGTTSAPGTGTPRRGESTRARRQPEGRHLLTVLDVADRCDLSVKAIYRAIERRELRAAKLCSRLRVRPEDVDAWIERNTLDRSTVPAVAEHWLMRVAATNGLRAMLDADARGCA